jgi:hypothetical protein
MKSGMWSVSDFEPEPRITKFVEFFDALVSSYQVTEDWQRLGATLRRHARQIRNADDADEIPDPD